LDLGLLKQRGSRIESNIIIRQKIPDGNNGNSKNLSQIKIHFEAGLPAAKVLMY